MNGCVALVTGGSRRIGRALCEGLAAAGYRVAVHANGSLDEASALAARLGSEAQAFRCDLRDRAAVADLVPRVRDALGPVGLLVNNASVFEHDGPADAGDDLWDAHFDVHLRAPVRLAQALVDGLPDAADGHVVNMIDQRVWRLNPQFTSYTLSKSAMWTMTRTLAQRFAPRVRVNAIGPGPSLPSPRQAQESFDAQVDAVPLRRGPTLDEFSQALLFLERARSVTGQMIALDGGQHLAWRTPDFEVPE